MKPRRSVDAPVCDVTSWPGGKGKGDGSQGDWQQLLKVYGLTEKQVIEGKISPIDHLWGRWPPPRFQSSASAAAPTRRCRWPRTRPSSRSGTKKLGGSITVIVKPGLGHHPHSLKDPMPIVDFVLKHAGCSTASH